MSDHTEGHGSRERHEPDVWHEPTWARKEQPNASHAGNGTVNHGPDEQSPAGPSLDGQHPDNPDSPETPGNSGNSAGNPEGFDPDELALRRLLHQAVQEVEPRDGTLDHLRKAVPARRARKRQAVVGMAAAALFFGTAIPALVHVSNSSGSGVDPSIAGNSSQAQGGTSQGKNPDGGSSTSGGSSGQASGQNPGGHKNDGTGKAPGQGTVTANPTASIGTAAPVCTAGQFGASNSTVNAADSAGIVYGTFTVTNTSSTSCTVGGPGTVGFTAVGAADGTKINVAQHSSGDVAVGLPDPSTEASQLVLLPGSTYQVKFAWVPSETCPTSTPTGESSPSPTPTEDASTSSGSTTGDTGTSTQLLEDGTLDGSVVVSHTAQAGSPTVSATVPNACAGTVYRTGVLAGS
ncbi:hypothetical protein AB0I69_05805 [Streptomyces sp. NPDC050508]|uniref:hypothetical protein n=1 Tax=Streptomyces sp. NPDC050508 TaxID=3155405 RepID=UPI003443152E